MKGGSKKCGYSWRVTGGSGRLIWAFFFFLVIRAPRLGDGKDWEQEEGWMKQEREGNSRKGPSVGERGWFPGHKQKYCLCLG